MTMQLTLDQVHSDLSQQQLTASEVNEATLTKGRIDNFISSVQAYADMSPDLTMRREVNSWMIRRDRTSLSLLQWSELFGSTNEPVLAFIYKSFGEYSGLDFSRVRPNDSLNNHLYFPLVCWFDWTITFCEDFFQAFGVDLSDRFDEADFDTIGELVDFLMRQAPVSEG